MVYGFHGYQGVREIHGKRSYEKSRSLEVTDMSLATEFVNTDEY